MGIYNRYSGKSLVLKRQIVSVCIMVLPFLVFSLPTQGVEVGLSGHLDTQNEAHGYSLFVSDNFSRRSPLYWSAGFTRYEDVSVEWNNSNLEFPLDSAEIALSYRHQFTARNPTIRRFSMEYQIGAAVALTENKFTWAELNEEKYFSEKGDVNGFVAISTHYQFSSNVSAVMGVKHFPQVSDFDSVSSIFLGVKFNLNFGPTYYGN